MDHGAKSQGSKNLVSAAAYELCGLWTVTRLSEP